MIRFVYGHDAEVGAFIAQQTGLSRGIPTNSKTIGVIDDQDRFLGGVAYHHWSPEAETIMMSGAAAHPRWLTRTVLKRIFDYPFEECGCQMLVMQLSARDLRLQRQLAVVGFGFTRIARLFGRDQDGIVATLTEEDWRSSPFNRSSIELEEAA